MGCRECGTGVQGWQEAPERVSAPEPASLQSSGTAVKRFLFWVLEDQNIYLYLPGVRLL